VISNLEIKISKLEAAKGVFAAGVRVGFEGRRFTGVGEGDSSSEDH